MGMVFRRCLQVTLLSNSVSLNQSHLHYSADISREMFFSCHFVMQKALMFHVEAQKLFLVLPFQLICAKMLKYSHLSKNLT